MDKILLIQYMAKIYLMLYKITCVDKSICATPLNLWLHVFSV